MAERNTSSDVDESDDASDESDTQEEDEKSFTEVASSSEGPNGTVPSALEMVQQSIALVKADDMVSTSCRGKEAILLIDSVVGRGDRFSRFCEKLVDELHQCFYKSRTRTGYSPHKLWNRFAITRVSKSLRTVWHALVNFAPEELSYLALQLLLTRCIKLMIKSLTNEAVSTTSYVPLPLYLSLREKNAIRYMAGYVFMKLKNSFSKTQKSNKDKRAWFFSTLNSLHLHVPALSTDYTSIQDYTEQWVEQLDRGGLYRISNEVTLLQLHGMLL